MLGHPQRIHVPVDAAISALHRWLIDPADHPKAGGGTVNLVWVIYYLGEHDI